MYKTVCVDSASEIALERMLEILRQAWHVNNQRHAVNVLDLPRVMFEHRLWISQKTITKLHSLTAVINATVIMFSHYYFSVKTKQL